MDFINDTDLVTGTLSLMAKYSESMGSTALTLSDGRSVSVIPKATEPSEIRITDNTFDVALPYPSCGYGGHQLELSKNERFLAAGFFSGQGDNWIELFELNPLRHSKSISCKSGFSSCPTFSDDEKLLIIACTVNASLYVEDYKNNDSEFVEDDTTVPWVTLEVIDIETNTISTCEVKVLLRKGQPIEQETDFYLGNQIDVSAKGIQLYRAWDEPVIVPFPLTDITIEGPA